MPCNTCTRTAYPHMNYIVLVIIIIGILRYRINSTKNVFSRPRVRVYSCNRFGIIHSLICTDLIFQATKVKTFRQALGFNAARLTPVLIISNITEITTRSNHMSLMKKSEADWYLDILTLFYTRTGMASVIGVRLPTLVRWLEGSQLPDIRYRPALREACEKLTDYLRNTEGVVAQHIADTIDQQEWPPETRIESTVSSSQHAVEYLINYLKEHGRTRSTVVKGNMTEAGYSPGMITNASMRAGITKEVVGFGPHKKSFWSI